MAIVIDGSGLTIEKVVKIARDNEKVELAPAALERIKKCRAMLDKKIEAHEIMYGINSTWWMPSRRPRRHDDEVLSAFHRYDSVRWIDAQRSFPIKTLTLEVGTRRPLGAGAGGLAFR